MTSQGGRSCGGLGAEARLPPVWDTFFIDNSAAKYITVCLNMSQG